MRQLPLVLLLAACGAGNPALERRVADLEARPAVPVPTRSPEVASLEIRVASLERSIAKLSKEQQELQDIVHQVADQLADLQADAPMPAPVAPVAPAVAPARRTPDPARAHAVVLADSPQFGPRTAAVTLVAAVQFPEPFTHKSWPVLAQLQSEYGNELRLVIKSYIVHPQATESSIAACAVANQKLLDPFEAALWDAANPSGGARTWPDAAASRDLARRIGADLVKFDKAVARACRDGQARDIQMFARLGQSAVPVFWINGRPLSGAQPIESFRTLIDEERAKAEVDRKRGGKPTTYYDRLIKGAGSP